jgi:hypothetical protein
LSSVPTCQFVKSLSLSVTHPFDEIDVSVVFVGLFAVILAICLLVVAVAMELASSSATARESRSCARRGSAFVIASPDSPAVQQQFARSRGWRFPMVSHQGTMFADDKGLSVENRRLATWHLRVPAGARSSRAPS